jgi:hypothetical protein
MSTAFSGSGRVMHEMIGRYDKNERVKLEVLGFLVVEKM